MKRQRIPNWNTNTKDLKVNKLKIMKYEKSSSAKRARKKNEKRRSGNNARGGMQE